MLVVSLFLTWLSLGEGFSLWKVSSGIDIVLALLGIAAAAIAGVRATGGTLPAPPETLKWIGAIASTIVLVYIIENDNVGIGAFLGVLAALAILAGAILAERPDLAARLESGIDAATRPSAAPPAGLGSSTTTGTPGSASPPSAASAEPATSVQPATGAGAASPPTPPSAAAPGGAAASAPAQPAQSAGPPPGWYPDPQGQARLRYWDGAGWTEQTSA